MRDSFGWAGCMRIAWCRDHICMLSSERAQSIRHRRIPDVKLAHTQLGGGNQPVRDRVCRRRCVLTLFTFIFSIALILLIG